MCIHNENNEGRNNKHLVLNPLQNLIILQIDTFLIRHNMQKKS